MGPGGCGGWWMRTLQSDRCHSPGYTTGVSISEASGPPRVNWKNSSHRADQLLRVDVGSRRSFRLSTGCWICAACFGQGRASSQRRQQDGESGAAPRVAPWWILGKKGVFFRLLFHFGVGSRIFFLKGLPVQSSEDFGRWRSVDVAFF